MKVLIVTEYYYPHIGGLEKLFQNIAEGLVRAGHKVDVVTALLPGTEAEEELNGVSIHRVRVPQTGDRYWFTVAAIVKSLKYAKGADVIETTTYNGAFPAWLAARIRGKPVAIFTHEVVGKNWHRIGLSRVMASMYSLLETMTLSLPFDSFICNSDSTASALRKWGAPKKKIRRVYPGIDYSLFDPEKNALKRDETRARYGIAPDEFVYMFFGRPGYVKGVEYLLRAVPSIKRRIPDSRALLILSRKPVEGYRRVEEIVGELSLEPDSDVMIIDPVPEPDLPAHLMTADCVVVPSLSEGFGFTCVEACTMERPVVASDTTSLPEVIFGNYVLVPPGDSEAIAEGVERVFVREYEKSEKKRFSWEEAVNGHLDIFSELIGGQAK